MDNIISEQLQTLYDDSKISDFISEIVEYYATKSDYADSSFEEEIEPSEIVEPIFILFCLQNRDDILDTFSYIQHKYPALGKCISPIYNELLINMDVSYLESRLADQLAQSTDGVSAKDIIERVNHFASRFPEISEAEDEFYSWFNNHRQ